MSENIIERAAIAITPGWATASRNTKRNAMLTVAGVVLEAIREPTEAMCEAAYNLYGIADNGGTERAYFEDEYRAAIDAALADKPV